MLKQVAVITMLATGLAGVSVANAGETNPLNPSYPTFAAAIDFGSKQGAVEIAKNPLTPSYYQWNVATINTGNIVEIVMNNPLQPNYKRS
jgi:hypothetical protein